jgi:hypothetical protein
MGRASAVRSTCSDVAFACRRRVARLNCNDRERTRHVVHSLDENSVQGRHVSITQWKTTSTFVASVHRHISLSLSLSLHVCDLEVGANAAQPAEHVDRRCSEVVRRTDIESDCSPPNNNEHRRSVGHALLAHRVARRACSCVRLPFVAANVESSASFTS